MSNETAPEAPRKYKRVPLSPAVVWSTVRRQIVPFLVLAGVFYAIVSQWGNLSGGGVAGVAEGLRSTVSAPLPGVIKELRVGQYEWVEAGQVLAVLQPTDPRIKLDLAQSELQASRLLLEPSTADRNALDYERLRVEELRLREELALAEVNLQQAEAALRRSAALRGQKLVSEDSYDIALRDRDYYKAQIALKKGALQQVEGRVAALRPLGEPTSPGTNTAIQELADDARRRIRDAAAGWGPIELVAPISGMVHMINRQPGENVAEGEPLLAIFSSKSERIVAYLRQPYPVDPRPGLEVEVLTRTAQRQSFHSKVTQVGAQVEPITNSLAFFRPGLLVDVGLPVVVHVPPEVQLRPGETVEIIFTDRNKPALRLDTARRQNLHF
jgi:multidrug resistance efflux pump